MRPIKFRVWDVQRHKMHYLESTDDNHNHYLQTGVDGFWLYASSDGKLICNYRSGDLMQYVGLTDKNGKEIYEGDLCRYASGMIRETIWRNGAFGYMGMMGDEFIAFARNPRLAEFLQTIEVIDNIYENPELLTQ